MLLRPNQSLKLTEVAVDDFAARQYAENDIISRYVRAMNYMELAVRRRSLPVPLLFGGSSGPLGRTTNIERDLHLVHVYVNFIQ